VPCDCIMNIPPNWLAEALNKKYQDKKLPNA
jgi:hypothetical protein